MVYKKFLTYRNESLKSLDDEANLTLANINVHLKEIEISNFRKPFAETEEKCLESTI